MKNLNLNNYGVQEMNAEETLKTDGGVSSILIPILKPINPSPGPTFPLPGVDL